MVIVPIIIPEEELGFLGNGLGDPPPLWWWLRWLGFSTIAGLIWFWILMTKGSWTFGAISVAIFLGLLSGMIPQLLLLPFDDE